MVKAGGARASTRGVRRQVGGAMRVVRGAGVAHLTRGPRIGMRSFTTAGALRKVVPPPPRHGESDPDHWRPFGRQGGISQRVSVSAQAGWNTKTSNGATPV